MHKKLSEHKNRKKTMPKIYATKIIKNSVY